jgi:hypothetical protein
MENNKYYDAGVSEFYNGGDITSLSEKIPYNEANSQPYYDAQNGFLDTMDKETDALAMVRRITTN